MTAWLLTITVTDITQNAGLTFLEKRDEIVRRIRYSGWDRLTAYKDSLHGLLNELSATETSDDFDAVSQDIFDLADSDGVWIEREGTVIEL